MAAPNKPHEMSGALSSSDAGTLVNYVKDAKRKRTWRWYAVLAVVLAGALVGIVIGSLYATGVLGGPDDGLPGYFELRGVYRVPNGTIPSGTRSRHIAVGMDQVVVAVLSKAVVVIQFEPEGGKLLGNWTLPVEDGVTISEPMILPGDSKSFVVLKATSSDLAVLKLALPGHPSAAVLTVLASFNLTSLTAPYFSGLPLEYSIQLRNNYPSHTLFTCLSDHNRTTYLHRLDLPSFKIEQMGVIQSLNLTGPTSYFLADGVVPLSAPLFAIPSRADAYVALVNTTTLEAYYKETHFPFVPSRGTMFPDGGSTLVVPGGPGAQPDPYAPAFPLGYGYGLSSAPYYFRDGYINGTRPDVIYNPLKNWVFAATYGSQIDYWYYEQTQFNLNLVSQRAVVKAVGSVESLAAWGALYAIGTDESDVVVSQFLLRRK